MNKYTNILNPGSNITNVLLGEQYLYIEKEVILGQNYKQVQSIYDI